MNCNRHGNGDAEVGVGKGGGKGGRQSGSGGRRGGSGQNERITEQLEKTLRASGFCQKGFIELERETNPPTTSIRGECNDTASTGDLKKFPNSDDSAG